MPVRDLREWIALLEREGELVRVAAEVDPHLEVTEIVDRVVKSGGPALLFERPKGSDVPLLINQFGTEKRMCLAFGVDRLDDISDRVADILEMQPPEGLVQNEERDNNQRRRVDQSHQHSGAVIAIGLRRTWRPRLQIDSG